MKCKAGTRTELWGGGTSPIKLRGVKIKATSCKNKLILLLRDFSVEHTHSGQTNICWICKAYGPPNPLMLNHGCTCQRSKRGLSLLHWRWNTASPKHVRLSNQAFARGHVKCKWTGSCVPASISVWWWNSLVSTRQKGALVLQCCSLPQSMSQWGSAWGMGGGQNVAFLGLQAHIP